MIHRGECGLQSTPHAVPKLSHPLECLHRIRLGLAKRVKQWENVHHTLACMKLHVHTLHSLCPLHQRSDLVVEALRRSRSGLLLMVYLVVIFMVIMSSIMCALFPHALHARWQEACAGIWQYLS